METLRKVTLQRFDAFSSRSQQANGEADLSMWLQRGPYEPHPLARCLWRSARPIALGKTLVVPDRMATYEVRIRWKLCMALCIALLKGKTPRMLKNSMHTVCHVYMYWHSAEQWSVGKLGKDQCRLIKCFLKRHVGATEL